MVYEKKFRTKGTSLSKDLATPSLSTLQGKIGSKATLSCSVQDKNYLQHSFTSNFNFFQGVRNLWASLLK